MQRMSRFEPLQVDLDAETGTVWELDRPIDDLERLPGQTLAVLPDPMSIYSGYVSRSCRRYMGKHGQRDVEVIVGVRSPGEAPVAAELRYAHGALHGPEMRIGQRNVQCAQLHCMLQLAPVGGNHVGGRG